MQQLLSRRSASRSVSFPRVSRSHPTLASKPPLDLNKPSSPPCRSQTCQSAPISIWRNTLHRPLRVDSIDIHSRFACRLPPGHLLEEDATSPTFPLRLGQVLLTHALRRGPAPILPLAFGARRRVGRGGDCSGSSSSSSSRSEARPAAATAHQAQARAGELRRRTVRLYRAGRRRAPRTPRTGGPVVWTAERACSLVCGHFSHGFSGLITVHRHIIGNYVQEA